MHKSPTCGDAPTSIRRFADEPKMLRTQMHTWHPFLCCHGSSSTCGFCLATMAEAWMQFCLRNCLRLLSQSESCPNQSVRAMPSGMIHWVLDGQGGRRLPPHGSTSNRWNFHGKRTHLVSNGCASMVDRDGVILFSRLGPRAGQDSSWV